MGLLCAGLRALMSDLAYTTQRNARTDGSHPLLRPDATYGQPPIVEEKAEAGALKQAERELHQEFARIPQYSRMQFVVGVAIAGDQVSFQTLGSQTLTKVKVSLADAEGRAK